MVMGHGPQDSRGIHHVSVTVDTDGQPAVLFVRERGARGSRRAVALACSTRSANELGMFVEGPQPHRPAACKSNVRYERPILILDCRPQFSRQTSDGDRARVPAVGRFGARALQGSLTRIRQLGAAVLI